MPGGKSLIEDFDVQVPLDRDLHFFLVRFL
jgi:hypothetical protein